MSSDGRKHGIAQLGAQQLLAPAAVLLINPISKPWLAPPRVVFVRV